MQKKVHRTHRHKTESLQNRSPRSGEPAGTDGSRDYRADAALRPQPKRMGHDLLSTPSCLIGTAIEEVLPRLPTGRVWEPAAGNGRLARASCSTGRVVIATDIETCNFLEDEPPGEFAVIMTNSPFNRLDAFMHRALADLDAGVTQVGSTADAVGPSDSAATDGGPGPRCGDPVVHLAPDLDTRHHNKSSLVVLLGDMAA